MILMEIRGIKIDKTARRVWVNGRRKHFTSKEYDLPDLPGRESEQSVYQGGTLPGDLGYGVSG